MLSLTHLENVYFWFEAIFRTDSVGKQQHLPAPFPTSSSQVLLYPQLLTSISINGYFLIISHKLARVTKMKGDTERESKWERFIEEKRQQENKIKK